MRLRPGAPEEACRLVAQGRSALKSFLLVGDREFGGEHWRLQLARLDFFFVMCIKSNRQLILW